MVEMLSDLLPFQTSKLFEEGRLVEVARGRSWRELLMSSLLSRETSLAAYLALRFLVATSRETLDQPSSSGSRRLR